MTLPPDQSMAKRDALSFPDSLTTRTVQDMGWTGTANGLLLSLGALLTVNRGIEYQQNLSPAPTPVIIMPAPRNRLAELQPLVPFVARALRAVAEPKLPRVELRCTRMGRVPNEKSTGPCRRCMPDGSGCP